MRPDDAPSARRLARFFDPGRPRWVTIPVSLLALGLVVFQGTTVPALIFGEHDWRQADTFSVAYWFRHLSPDFFRPQIDWGSEHSGIMGMEVPVYSFVVYLLSYVLGDQPFVGRLVNWALFWPIAFVFARRFSISRAGAALMLLAFTTSPMGLYEFREVQPDPFMTSFLALASIALDRSASARAAGDPDGRAAPWLFCGYAATVMAVLSKVPAIVALPALLVLAIGKEKVLTRRTFVLGLLFLVPVSMAVVWDSWAHHLNVVYNGGTAYFHIDFSLALVRRSLTKLDIVFNRFLFREFPAYVMGWVWTPAFLAGLPVAFLEGVRRQAVAMLAWLVAGLFFCSCFSDRLVAHWYYALVAFVPATYFIGKGLENVVLLWAGESPTSFARRALAWAVVFASLLTPVIGGALKQGNMVPGSGKAAIPWATWCVGFAPLWLIAAAVLGCAFAALPRWSTRSQVIGAAAALALVSSGLRGAHDAVGAVFWRGKLHERTAIERSIRQLETAADALVPLRDKILVDMRSPAYLRRARRHGFAVALKTVNKESLRSFARKGASYLVHFGEGPPPKNTPATPIATGDDWAMYCLRPAGCLGPDGVVRGAAPEKPDAPVLPDAGAAPDKPESPETPETAEPPEGKP